jgi:hypothetical protein
MGQNYLTKYRCPDTHCEEALDSWEDAYNHCVSWDIDELYICESCGYETTDNTDVETECKLHG